MLAVFHPETCLSCNPRLFDSLKVPVRGVGVVLYNVSTLGIPSVYHRHYGYHARSLARRVIGLGLPANVTTYDLPLYHYDPTLYELTPQQIWEETFNQIAAGWKTLLAVSSTAVLGCASLNLIEFS